MEELIKKDLLELPGVILEMSKDIYNKKIEVETMKISVKKIESKTMADILNEIDEMGKPVFSNDTKRKIACDEKISSNKEYSDTKAQMDNLQVEIDHLMMNLEFIRNTFSAARALARLGDE